MTDIPTRPPTATPVAVYGNNVAVACPCGAIVLARTLDAPGRSGNECRRCGRWYQGVAHHQGGHVASVYVWEGDADGDNDPPTYQVNVESIIEGPARPPTYTYRR
jgi:hypothetical protein